ncbi:MAG: hypothetical protein O7D96_04465 [SAR324 cluster bacterium]|nr:hypothetical protein [SAR324 cluster bacterium]
MNFAQPKSGSRGGNPTLVLCKPAFEAALSDEIAAKAPGAGNAGPHPAIEARGRGWLRIGCGAPLPPQPLIFERQRLPDARSIEGASRRGLARAAAESLLPALGSGGAPWTLHAFTPDPNGAESLHKRAAGIGSAFREALRELAPRMSEAYRCPEEAPGKGCRVVQLCLTEAGLWVAQAPVNRLPSPFPGGIPALSHDPAAPSRSYLKIEEALAAFGEAPRAGQRVVDLGAAPGGWSYAFLKRGCRVTAVDRAALKLPSSEAYAGAVTHLREDGLRYRPERPVDWLLSDMLIAPGVTLGLLRKWIGRGWARRSIVNVKLPQREPYAALRPLERFLGEAGLAGGALRQLYHDRREVTAWGHIAPLKAGNSGKAKRRP